MNLDVLVMILLKEQELLVLSVYMIMNFEQDNHHYHPVNWSNYNMIIPAITQSISKQIVAITTQITDDNVVDSQ